MEYQTWPQMLSQYHTTLSVDKRVSKYAILWHLAVYHKLINLSHRMIDSLDF